MQSSLRPGDLWSLHANVHLPKRRLLHAALLGPGHSRRRSSPRQSDSAFRRAPHPHSLRVTRAPPKALSCATALKDDRPGRLLMSHKILVAQGGGPTAVINQSLVGVALEARHYPDVSAVYGARHGVRGIVDDDLVDLGQETVGNLEAVAATPAAALGSTRDKPDLKYCQEIFKVLKAHEIDTFFYIGGNDSSDTVRIVAEEAKKGGHALRAIHIPKTIDNDLVGFDHVPGYPSAARFVAQAFAGANLDNLALKGVYCAVVMGRHAGFLTAASALARKYPDDGPHLIYLPERTFVVDKFLGDVKRTFELHGRCIIAVSEGVHDEKGEAIITKLMGKTEKDAHGNVQLSGTGALADLLCEEVKAKIGIKRVRGDTFGYLQRSFVGCVSKVDQREAREVGEKAVQYVVRA